LEIISYKNIYILSHHKIQSCISSLLSIKFWKDYHMRTD